MQMGSQLAFMDELDLYTLFGNALDNAIEANRKISNVHERMDICADTEQKRNPSGGDCESL